MGPAVLAAVAALSLAMPFGAARWIENGRFILGEQHRVSEAPGVRLLAGVRVIQSPGYKNIFSPITDRLGRCGSKSNCRLAAGEQRATFGDRHLISTEHKPGGIIYDLRQFLEERDHSYVSIHSSAIINEKRVHGDGYVSVFSGRIIEPVHGETLQSQARQVGLSSSFGREFVLLRRLQLGLGRLGLSVGETNGGCCAGLDGAGLLGNRLGLLFGLGDLLAHKPKLGVQRVGFAFGLPGFNAGLLGQRGETLDRIFDIFGVSRVQVSQVRDNECPDADKKRQLFADRQTLKKIGGLGLAMLATVMGAIAAALAIGAADGPVFGLSGRDRIRFVAYALALAGLAAWIVYHWVAPLLA